MTISLGRLGSSNAYDSAMRNIQERQTALSNLQENLTSGKRVVKASDDPTGAAQAERALTRLSRIETDQRALAAQRNTIAQAESTLGDILSDLQIFREKVVAAGNGAHSAAESKSIAQELSGLRDSILSKANRTDTNGLPLFSALGSALQPFVGPQGLPQDYTFQGLPGQSASSEVSIPTTLDGEAAFMFQPGRDGVYNTSVTNMAAPAHKLIADSLKLTNAALATGATYTMTIDNVDNATTFFSTTLSYTITESPNTGGPYSGSITYPRNDNYSSNVITTIPGISFNLKGTPQVGDTLKFEPRPSVFSVLDDAIRGIDGLPAGNDRTQAVAQALNNIDIGMGRISAVRGQAGDLLNRADAIEANQQKRSIQVEGDRSRAEDLDMTQGISDFQKQQTAYQAALQSYAQVQKLNLFNYIG